MRPEPLDRLRAICLALPEATEQGGVGDPTFRVRDKIFAMRHGVDRRMSMWCKAPPGAQAALVGSDPQRFFMPPYVGCHGWVGLWLDVELDWEEERSHYNCRHRPSPPTDRAGTLQPPSLARWGLCLRRRRSASRRGVDGPRWRAEGLRRVVYSLGRPSFTAA